MRTFEDTRSRLSLSRGGQVKVQGRGNNVNRVQSPPSSASDNELDMDTEMSDSVVVDKLVADEADKKSTTSSCNSPAGSIYSNDPDKKEKLRQVFQTFDIRKQGGKETTKDQEDKDNEANFQMSDLVIRIRKDIFEENQNEEESLKEQVVKMKECVGNLCTNLHSSLKNLENAGSTGSVKEFLTCYQHLKQTLFASYYCVDELDLELRAEDVYCFQIKRNDPDYANYETITLEEMADYFLKLLALGFFLREESCAPWRSNLVAYHLRISRILNFYMVGRNVQKTESTIVNLIHYIGAQTSKFMIPVDLLVGLTDHIKRFHERALVDDSIVIYEHCTQGFKGFSRSIDAILRKMRDIRYKAHGLTAPARDSEGKGYSFENDLEILWEISDRVFENPAEPYKGMSAEALARIRDYNIPKSQIRNQ